MTLSSVVLALAVYECPQAMPSDGPAMLWRGCPAPLDVQAYPMSYDPEAATEPLRQAAKRAAREASRCSSELDAVNSESRPSWVLLLVSTGAALAAGYAWGSL